MGHLFYKDTINQLPTIAMTELALKNSVQDSLKLTPALILYGQPIKTPMDILDGDQGEGSGTIRDMQDSKQLDTKTPRIVYRCFLQA